MKFGLSEKMRHWLTWLTQNMAKGAFNNYVDKMRGKGPKNVGFCPRSGYKNCPGRVGGQ